MGRISVWRGTTEATSRPALEQDLSADVVVVGGGITGVTAAMLLAQGGRSVVLLEAHEIGSGDTGNSTGNLYATLSAGLRKVRERWGPEVTRGVVESRRETVDFIEQQVRQFGIDCDFRRCDLYRYAGSLEAQHQVDKEFRVAREAGLSPRMLDALPEGPPPARGVIFALEQQAQFHPMAYVQALAQQAAAAGCRVFEHSPVLEVDRSKGTVRTARGSVSAREIVLATHSPSGLHLVQAGMMVHREYGLAAPIPAGSFPAGIFWAEGGERLSTRSVDTADGSFLICIGQHHKSGQHDAQAALQELEDSARRRLGVQDIAYRWSAQNFHSPDGLPYIGPDASGVHIATGFATNGLVYGSLAASIIADRILGRENRWSELYRARRFEPLKSARHTVEETLATVKVFVEDYVAPRRHEPLENLAPGSGGIVEVNGERLAAYRDPEGQTHLVSPVCTHMKCMVRWNSVETSWDCPCHGSRFAPDGRVLNGPATVPLERKPLPGR